jgi:hypothetical protein
MGTKRQVHEWKNPAPIRTVKISDSQVVFSHRGADRSWALSLFDASADVVDPLPIKDCFPTVWRQNTSELVCQSFSSSEHYTIDLGGRTRSKLPLNDYDDPVTYIPDLDALLLARPVVRAQGEQRDLYLYTFERGKIRPLVQNLRIYWAQAIWVTGK